MGLTAHQELPQPRSYTPSLSVLSLGMPSRDNWITKYSIKLCFQVGLLPLPLQLSLRLLSP